MELVAVDPARAQRAGRIGWFSLATLAGEPIWKSTAGSDADDGAEVILSRRAVEVGDVVEIERFAWVVTKK